MKKRLLILILASANALLFSCNPDDSAPETVNDSIIVDTDQNQLSSRLSHENSGVIGITSEADFNARKLGLSEEEGEPGSLPLELITQVKAPEYEGNTLQATHVDIDGNYAYVTYNTQGPKYLGAVDIFDISDVLEPVIVSQAIFTNADLNAVDYLEGKLFISGSVNVDSGEDVDGPANLITVSTSNGQFTSDFEYTTIQGYVGTDVNHTDNHVVTTSGTDGTVTLLDKSNSSIVREENYPDLRSIIYGQNTLFVLCGEEGINYLDPSSLETKNTIALSSDQSGSKRTMDLHNDILLVAEGANGAGFYNAKSGNEMTRLSIPVVTEGLNPNEVVTNAITSNDKHLFMANGAAGVSAGEFAEDDKANSLGVLDIFGSVNYVKANDEYLFVASGLEGLQIIKINLAEDINDEVCNDLPTYKGNPWMNINSGKPQGYSGSLVAHGLNVNDDFTFCGSLAVKGWANINSGGTFNMRGSLVIGQSKKDSGLQINDTLIIDGSLVIYGNLTLNSEARLEFLGEDSSITVYGNVLNNGATITGNYTDTEGKLK